jgi:trehalose 6-phosphate synthase
MPLEERRNRHQAMMETLRRSDVHWWCDSFLAALASARAEEKGPTWLRL